MVAFNASAQIGDDIHADRYLLKAKTSIDNQNFAEALEYLKKITNLDVEPPADFYYIYAYTLFINNDLSEALEKVKLYIEIAGKNGCYYEQALELWNEIEAPQILTDIRDDKSYRSVRIGTQTWMAENLDYYTSGSWCYDDKTSNCDKYGRLYNWIAALKACPQGWHLPSDEEWTVLVNYLGGVDIAGGKLKSTSSWNYPNVGASNRSIFSALPGGSRNGNGYFDYLGESSHFWSSTEINGFLSSYWYLENYSSEVFRYGFSKDYARSIRCLKN